MLADRYYYHRLSKKNQILYQQIYNAVLQFEQVCTCEDHNYSASDLSLINQAIAYDNPFLFYYKNQFCIQADGRGKVHVHLSYFFNKKEYDSLQLQVRYQAERFLKRADLNNKTDEERVRSVHDLLAKHVTYDTGCLNKPQDSEDFIYSHTILGVILKKRAVCEGIAKTVKYLLNAINIGCIVVFGNVDESSGSAGNETHAWNIVKIDGENYYLDVTWDIASTDKDVISYDYYNLTEELIRKDHYDFNGYPRCDSLRYNYFVFNSAVMHNEKELLNYTDRMFIGIPSRIYVRLDFACEYLKLVEKVQKRLRDRMYDRGIAGTVQSLIKEKQCIIDISVTK